MTHRHNTARQLLQRSATIEIRHRSLMDAASLCMGHNIVAADWPFTALLELQLPHDPPGADVDATLWAALEEAVHLAQQVTPRDFTDFMLTLRLPLLNEPAPATLALPQLHPPLYEEYLADPYAFFFHYMPYLTCHLPASDASLRIVRARLMQLVGLCQGPSEAEDVQSLGQRRIRLWQEPPAAVLGDR